MTRILKLQPVNQFERTWYRKGESYYPKYLTLVQQNFQQETRNPHTRLPRMQIQIACSRDLHQQLGKKRWLEQAAFLPISLLVIALICVFSASLIRIIYMYQQTIQYSPAEYKSNSNPNIRKREAIQYVCSSTHMRMCLHIFMQIFCDKIQKMNNSLRKGNVHREDERSRKIIILHFEEIAQSGTHSSKTCLQVLKSRSSLQKAIITNSQIIFCSCRGYSPRYLKWLRYLRTLS